MLTKNWPLVCFIALGAFLRIYNFWLPELWLDEYGTWWLAAKTWNVVAQRASAFGAQSTFYCYVVKLSSDLLGPGPVSLRLPSILFGVATLVLVYPLGIRLFRDPHAALLAVAVFSMNELMIWHSQNARPYALALFFVMLSFLFYVSLLEEEKRSYRIGYVLATSAAYYSQYLFGFIVVIQLLHVILTQKGSFRPSKVWILTFLAMGVLWIPGGFQLMSLFARRETLNWLPPITWADPFKLAITYLNPYAFLATAFVLLFLGWGKTNQSQYRVGKTLLFLWFVTPFVVFALVPPLFGITLFSGRYLLFTIPAALFTLAWLMASAVRERWRKWVPLAAFLVVTFVIEMIPPLQSSNTFVTWPDQGWTRAAEFLKTFARPDDAILLRTGFIEGDLLASSNSLPQWASALSWPLVAHLSPDYRYRVIDLPYNLNSRTLPYTDAVYAEARKYQMVWIVGQGNILPAFANELVTRSSFRPTRQTSFGTVQVISMEQENK